MENYWPKPEPIQSELPPMQTFDEDLLPPSIRPLVVDVSERMQTPMAYAAVMMLSLAGVVNRRAMIQPKANDPTWRVVPNLWGGIVGAPGVLKTPLIRGITHPLVKVEELWLHEYKAALEDYADEQEQADLRVSLWKEQYKQALKKNAPAPIKPDNTLVEPVLKRLIVNDATVEKLHELLQQNPAGLLVIRDELAGFFATLDKPGRENERAFCLEPWNGDGPFTIDRIGRGSIHVAHVCLSMLGSIQPGRLRSYLADTLADGPTNDGFMQRFQLMVWPDVTADWKYIDRPPDCAAEERVARVLNNLVRLDPEHPRCFGLPPTHRSSSWNGWENLSAECSW
jgi:putative DNA primase/helicase